ncbi:MAG: formylglycine-generating enzyme family protein, partial [Verrucomicrobiota bacterium]
MMTILNSRFRRLQGFIFCVAITLLLTAGCKRQTESPSSNGAITNGPARIELMPMTNMVLIKAGTFMRIKFPVTITHDYWIGKYEVTQGEYAGLMGDNPSHFKEGGTNCPVEKVSHMQAMSYCAALTRRERALGRLPEHLEYRLPTEAEWEYACRAGSTNQFSFGDKERAEEFAWTAENSEGKTHPVGQKLPNAWGLHDMHGNVWEWCLDWFAPYPARPEIDPVGPAEGKFKVFHGGGWNQEIEFAR